MEAIYTNFFEYILHFDRYLPIVMDMYGHWIYAILFLIVFCETGLVVTPFLPGDSLLFACGALAATPAGLDLTTLIMLFLVSAILGDACNYMIGEEFGYRILRKHPKLINPEHIKKAEDFYAKHGHKAIVLARFAPIVRTVAPFVAGIGSMHYRTFALYNVVGAFIWVFLFVGAGYLFGNIPWVKSNFSYVTLGIILVSLMPIVYETFIKPRLDKNKTI